MSSHLPRDEALEKEGRRDEMNKKKDKVKENSDPPLSHFLQAQQAPAIPYAKVVGRPDTGSDPAPLSNPTSHHIWYGPINSHE